MLYSVLGVYLFRAFLRRFDCYQRPIRGTIRGSTERRRALIATVPITIAYEIPHTKTALIHLVAALVISLPFIATHNKVDDKGVAYLLGTPLLLLNLVVNYFINVSPVLVQRCNRAELYNGIAEFQEENIGNYGAA